jgi:GDP-L-fucose synthase
MKNQKIYIAGHTGLVGSAITENLQKHGYENLLTATFNQLDLRNQAAVDAFMANEKPDFVIIAAAKVGGIMANSQYLWAFLYDNLMIEANLINAAHENGVQNLIFLGSSCIYPRLAPQPLKEEYLLTGQLEPTNEWYAIAKIAGIKLCQALNKQFGRNYISLMPTNMYGPGDNFDLQSSHVLPAMIRKFHEAKTKGHSPVTLWGTGSPMREFMHVTDLAEAIRFFMGYDGPLPFDLINVGTGIDLTIKELALTIQKATGHQGEIIWDTTKPDGTPRKLMDAGRMKSLGWEPKIELEKGISSTYEWYKENVIMS